MKLPCERALWYTLPRIRADLARKLIDEGLSQKDAAGLLGVTPAAVSQYMHKKRGSDTKMPKDYDKAITEAAERIKKDGDADHISALICGCCRMAAKES